MSYKAKFANGVNAEHPLGKGEVVSSILTGSTRKARIYWTWDAHPLLLRRAQTRTDAEWRVSIRGKSVEYVRRTFTERTFPIGDSIMYTLADKAARSKSGRSRALHGMIRLKVHPAA